MPSVSSSAMGLRHPKTGKPLLFDGYPGPQEVLNPRETKRNPNPKQNPKRNSNPNSISHLDTPPPPNSKIHVQAITLNLVAGGCS